MQERSARVSHGMSGHPVYFVWKSMIDRCRNPKNKDYRHYGGRGITVCDRWRESFVNFYSDMGDRPSDNHTLDRIDNNLGYNPDNCRWVTFGEQVRNKRNNVYLTWEGETKSAPEWAEDPRVLSLGIKLKAIEARSRAGWTDEEVLTTEVRMNPETLITFRDETLSLAGWSKRLGNDYNVVSRRLSWGWDIEKAITTPVRKHKSRS